MKPILLTIIAWAALFMGWSAHGQRVAEFSAAVGDISFPFILTNGCLCQLLQTGPTNGGRAVYSFTIAAAGQYAIQAVVQAPGEGANSFYIDIDSEPRTEETKWEIHPNSSFTTNCVTDATGTPRFFNLTSGTHQIIIRGRALNVRLSSISVAMRPKPPNRVHLVRGS